MKLKRISLANYRGFDQIDLDLEDDLTVIAGVNGVGKSAILNAIAVAMSHSLPQFTPSAEKPLSLSDTDVQYGKSGLTLSAKVELADAEVITDITRSAPTGSEKAKEFVTQRDAIRSAMRYLEKNSKEALEAEDQLHRIGLQLADATDVATVRLFPKVAEADQKLYVTQAKASGAQPIAILYSTARFLSRRAARLSSAKNIFLASAYKQALDQAEVSLYEFANWYRALSEGGIQMPELADTLKTKLQNTIAVFLPEMSDLQFHSDGQPRFSLQKNKARFYLEQLSDGERGILALVFDLSRRLATANPFSDDPIKNGFALVMIDEVELHLHPKWQREILNRLQLAFKNCQFVVTTHSPLVLGEAEARCVRFLDYKDGKIIDITPSKALGLDANRILSELMHAPVRNRKIDEKLDKLFDLIDEEEFDKARTELGLLRKKLGENDPELTRASSLIKFMEGDE